MIKEIERNDIPQCVKVIRTSFKTVADEFGFSVENAPAFTAFATTDEKLFFQLDIERRLMYACYSDNNEIIGYYALVIQENSECELNNLCVLPEYRHNHIGGQLLKSAFIQAQKNDCNKINIGIVEENQTLRKWYEKYGFVHTGTKKFDFFPFTCGYMEKYL